MKKPSVIIFSSTQGLNIAEAVQTQLEHTCVAELWNQGMFLYQYTLDALINVLANKDFAIIVMTADDLTINGKALDTIDVNAIKNTAAPSPRDNVIFELGLSIGVLGRERTFVIRDKNPLLKLPTDLAGYIILDFEYPHHHVSSRVAVGYACNQIKEVIAKVGLRIHTPTVPSLSLIPDEHLRSFGISIVGSTAAAVESLIRNEAARMPETQYLEYLINEINDLEKEDVLLAICGGKNYCLSGVYQYLNENIQLAHRDVLVHRLYVAPDGKFSDPEWEVIDAHLTWADNLPSFRVGVLVGESDCAKLRELNLPHRFGMVLTRHGGLWKSRIHYGLDNERQGGWEFRQEAIILKQRQIFDDLALKAKQVGVSSGIRVAMHEALDRLSNQQEKRLWRYGQDRPIIV
jgi:hypothetical protein